MNPGVTSKEAILAVCRRLVAGRGLSTLSMRAVAADCGIALGTLYNYFADKDELLIATVESIWREILRLDGVCRAGCAFPEVVGGLFARIQTSAAQYPDFLTGHTVTIAKAKRGEARSAMDLAFAQIRADLLAVLRADPQVAPDAFGGAFSEAAFVDLVLDQLLILLVKRAPDCDALTGLVRRVLYR